MLTRNETKNKEKQIKFFLHFVLFLFQIKKAVQISLVLPRLSKNFALCPNPLTFLKKFYSGSGTKYLKF